MPSVVANAAATVNGRPIGKARMVLVDAVSPLQHPNNRPESGVAVSWTALPSAMNVPARLTAGLEAIIPPAPAVAMSLKSRFNAAVSVPPDRLPVMVCVRAPRSDHDANRHRVRLLAENCVSATLTVWVEPLASRLR